MTIADRIKNRRIELNLSQSELAKRANYCDKTRISKIENSGNDVNMRQVRRLAPALGVSMEYLMGWEDEKGDATPYAQLVNAYVVNQKRDELFSIYEGLSPEKQATFEAYLKFLQAQP